MQVTMTPGMMSQSIIYSDKSNLWHSREGWRLVQVESEGYRCPNLFFATEFPMSDIESSYRVTADELRQFIERIERLDAEKKDLAEQQKEVMAEAKGRGYDTKVMRKLITMRRRDKDDIAEEEAILEMYKEALGM
jgi:uncharacterized protein (UPF0335 family)